MRSLMQCIALLMTALWLPSTLHCTLDALGIIEAHVTHLDHDTGCATHAEETQHAHDTCVIVEFSPWLNTASLLNAPPPKTIRHTTPSAPAAALPPQLLIPHFPPVFQPFSPSAFSPAWLPSRHFAERAAPMTRAPSPSLA